MTQQPHLLCSGGVWVQEEVEREREREREGGRLEGRFCCIVDPLLSNGTEEVLELRCHYFLYFMELFLEV